MVIAVFNPYFQKLFSKIQDQAIKNKLIKQFSKIRENPEIGKPMMYLQKGTREVRVPPFRLSYLYAKEEDKVVCLDLYHKDLQ